MLEALEAGGFLRGLLLLLLYPLTRCLSAAAGVRAMAAVAVAVVLIMQLINHSPFFPSVASEASF
ncbi:hypothetical protein U9M48_000915 [Paspalum notatum var. saurae]|uniref:Glycerol-3-phosphate acyltransferase RAM2/GPAT1-8 HAD-like domain-containing protein n=1 Tax=Paspalum notatum var. saurae TaxID=547442 RepID=A0AAQ3PL10_PASNO